MCKFLGINYEDSMLNFHQENFSKNLATPNGPRKNLSKPLMTDNKKKYLSNLSSTEIRFIEANLHNLMNIFGYEIHTNIEDLDNVHAAKLPRAIEAQEMEANKITDQFYTDSLTSQLYNFGQKLETCY